MAEEKPAAPAKPKNTALIMQIVFAVVNLGVVGFGAYLVYASTIGWSRPVITEESAQREIASVENDEAGPLIYTMEKFTVNLDGEPKRTIRLEVSFEMLGKDGFEEIMSPDSKAIVRDRVIKILNESTFADLEPIQGKLFLKQKMTSEVNSILKKGIVKQIYFSDFAVQ